MKIKTLLCALAVAFGIAACRAAENPTETAPNSLFAVSGTAVFIKTNYFKRVIGPTVGESNDVTVTITQTFNTKKIYSILSNAVAHASSYSVNLMSTNLPANGYIAFNPLGDDGGIVDGYFYVTNRSRFYFPLSGFDSQGNFYSWIELDTRVPYAPSGDSIIIGFGDRFYETDRGTYNEKTGNGTSSITATALLFIHDNPYGYDDADNSYDFDANSTGIEIHGLINITQDYKGGMISQWTARMYGEGNILLPRTGEGEVIYGGATFAKLPKPGPGETIPSP
jgi:hypothetical protein